MRTDSASRTQKTLIQRLAHLDRRVVYLLVLIALLVPLLLKVQLPPAPMHSAQRFFDVIEGLPVGDGRVVMVFFDFGPNSKAENFPQAEVALEHLMRRRIPVVVISQFLQAEPLLESIPAGVASRLMAQHPGETWEYGKDWINLGYRVGTSLFIQGMVKAENLVTYLKRDARGNDLTSFEMLSRVSNLQSISLVAHFSSLTGTLDTILQFFKSDKYRPPLIHGCTSITIPQAYIFLDSGQMLGLLEGVAGAASYSALLDEVYEGRPADRSKLMMTGIGVAHLVVIALVLLGNVAGWLNRRGGI